MVHEWLLFTLCLVFALCSAFNTNQSQTYGCNVPKIYEFDWTDVYNMNRKMPQGCACQKSSVSDDECTVFSCNCGCDLEAGACDYGCCCDPDCSAEEVIRFESSEFGCLSQEPDAQFQACYNAEAVKAPPLLKCIRKKIRPPRHIR